MAISASRQRRKTARKASDRRVVRVEAIDSRGNPRWFTADLTDTSEIGLGISLRTMLEPGSTIVIRANLGTNRPNVPMRVRVAWCQEANDGTFQAGLEFLDET